MANQSIQERQTRRRLKEDFEPHIDIGDLKQHSIEEAQKSLTSRALAALTLAAEAKLSVEEACACVVDESNDRGIDAVGTSLTQDTLFIVQAKTSSGGASLTEVQKFISGIRLVLNSDWDSCGPKLKARANEIDAALDSIDKVVAIYTHFGSENPSADSEVYKETEALKRDINSAGEILDFRYLNLKDNFDNKNVAQGRGSLDHSLTFNHWTTLTDYKSELIGIVNGEEIAELVTEFGDHLFDKNIRNVLKSSSVNENVLETAKTNPEDFWYFNNGITIVAGRIAADRIKPPTTDATFQLSGLSVVNGAQTCGSLYKAKLEGFDLENLFVTVRAISMESKQEGFEEKVTRFTNTQNQIGGREFVSLDPLQQEIRETLLSEKIDYSFRTGDKYTLDEAKLTFNLEDATRALSCLHSVDYAARAKREISKMWSNIHEAPYIHLFNKKNDPAVITNAVRVWLHIDSISNSLQKDKDPRASKILDHSSFIACAIAFRYLKKKQVDLSDISTDPVSYLDDDQFNLEDLFLKIVDAHEEVNSGGYPQSFFKNQKKTEDLAKDIIRVLFT